MTGTPPEPLVALTGLFQAIRLVDTLAFEGTADGTAFATSIGSIYTIEATSVADCYGGDLAGLEVGRGALRDGLARDEHHARLLRYAFTVMALERRLTRKPALLTRIAEGVAAAEHSVRHLGPTHDQVVARLADIYSETISQLAPRVLVRGSPLHLQQARIVAKIRALLLAAMRSAVLWRQLGGSRWHFVFRRRSLAGALAAWS